MKKENNDVIMEEELKNTNSFLCKIKTSFQTQRFKSGAYSSIVTIIVVAFVIGINILFAKLDLSTDLSSNNLFTLSKDSQNVISNLKNNVIIYYMVNEGDEEKYIYNVLKQYSQDSSKIKLEKINPVINPSFAKKQGIDNEISSNDVIVVNKKTKSAKYIANTDMYYTDSEDYVSEDGGATYLDVEGQVTSAIQNVTLAQKTNIYILSKHGEQNIGTSLKNILEKMNANTHALELVKKKEVPKDCDILVINGITTDITKEEKDRILNYLKSGKKAIITLAYTTQKMPNLEKVLEYYGISVTKGIICEGTGNYATYPNYIVPSASSDQSLVSELNGYVIFPDAMALTKQGDKKIRKSLSITELAKTSDSSYLKKDTSSGNAEKSDGDIDGPFAVGLRVKEKVGSKQTDLIVYSSAGAFEESFTSTSQIDNANLFKKSISAIFTAKSKKVSIDKKSLSYSYISVSSGKQIIWALIIIIILPGILLITGFAIWYVRRRK